jgi:hypothetical protein
MAIDCNCALFGQRSFLMNAPEIAELEQAIDTNDIDRVKRMMTRNPALHSAPIGYGKDGPLTWVAECRCRGNRRGPSDSRWQRG